MRIPGLLDRLDTAFWLTAAGIVLLLAASAFFSGAETALTAASRSRLKAAADRGNRAAALALDLTTDSERLIGALLLGNNLVNILAASLATRLLTRIFGDGGVAIATLVMTLLVLIFAEVTPKTYAITNPEKAAMRVAPLVAVMVVVLSPAVAAVRWLVNRMLRLIGVRADPKSPILAVREEILGAIELGHAEGAMEKDDRDRLLGALELSDRTVEEVMRHRSEIEMIDADAPPEEIIDQILASSHTRLPVYRDERENIVGIVNAKDVLRALYKTYRARGAEFDMNDFDILAVARPPYFVPETTPLDDQMREFLRQHTHFALVIDEYGTLQGLVTLEDILEEIVGEITDEHDRREEGPEPDGAGGWIVPGAMSVRELNRELGWHLPEDVATTVAGLVMHETRTIPEEGQMFAFHGFRFEILEREGNRIRRIRIRPIEPEDEGARPGAPSTGCAS